MKYDFNGVDYQANQLGGILGAMEDNLSSLRALKIDLMTKFKGAGATGYEDVMNELQTKMDQYGGTLNSVKLAINNVAGSQGLMRETDQSNGKMFYS
ncbi:WXG100 family type VII secretion target [Nocardia wallacei]|uniref:WXG100 family type VII secretion target n=1 Tax=Nocardia wallacei TaxID=480035 RepID=UPI002457847B|nr:WXG100 family type VII secretion target [Nocardia wallacei]